MERYVIHVTKLCNMKCLYCYEDDKTTTYDWESIKALIDEIVAYNKEFGIEFLGGEPMLAFDLIQKSVEYLESIEGVRVNDYVITTNGTIMNDEVIAFLARYQNVHYAVSIDGGHFANQLRILKNEKDAYKIATENIKRVIDELGPHRVGVHMVTHPYNVSLINNSVKLFYDLGVRSIGIGIIEKTISWGDSFEKEWINQLTLLSSSIKSNAFPGLYIDELNNLKSNKDQRYYIYNDEGAIIGESYGRAENDITSHNDKAIAVSSDISDRIYNMRETVYLIHQK